MPIKAKQVDPQRAIEFARGQPSTLKSSFNVFDESRQQTTAFSDDDDDSSSTSTSSEATAASEVLPSGSMSSPSQEPNKQGSQFKDAEELLLESARRRTKALLYPKSESIVHNRGVPPAFPQHNERLLRYERAKMFKSASKTVDEESLVSPAPDGSYNIDAPKPLKLGASPPDLLKSLDMPDTNPSPSSSGSDNDETETTGHTQTAEASPRVDNADTTHLDPFQKNLATFLRLLGKNTHPTPEPDALARQERLGLAKSMDVIGERLERNCRPPPRTFAELEQEAMLLLYRNWGNSTGAEGLQSGSPFVVADHAAEALAMSKAVCQHRRGEASHEPTSTAALPFPDEPMTLEEMAMTQHVRRNLAELPFFANISEDGTLLTTPATLSQQAQKRLNKFWLSVMWVERLVGDMGFVRSLAEFLYKHHKIFMQYVIHQSMGKTFKEIDDHDHEEYNVYEKFGQRVSTALLHVLTQNVPDFEEAEFVEALYDYPVILNPVGGDTNGSDALESQGILSYQAWRIISAMSDFESFFLWMMDYIKEEYEAELSTEAQVAVGGARGLRALLRSTYRFGSKASPEAASNTTLPLPLTVPPNEESLVELPSSQNENVLEAVSQVDQTGKTTPSFITDINNSWKPDTMPATLLSDITTQNRKVVTPTPSGSAGTHRFFQPNKSSRARAFRNLPALQAPNPNKSSLGHYPSSKPKAELRDSYPSALKRDTSTQRSGNRRESTNEVPSFSSITSTRKDANKKAVRFASSAPSKAPTTRTRSKTNRKA